MDQHFQRLVGLIAGQLAAAVLLLQLAHLLQRHRALRASQPLVFRLALLLLGDLIRRVIVPELDQAVAALGLGRDHAAAALALNRQVKVFSRFFGLSAEHGHLEVVEHAVEVAAKGVVEHATRRLGEALNETHQLTLQVAAAWAGTGRLVGRTGAGGLSI